LLLLLGIQSRFEQLSDSSQIVGHDDGTNKLEQQRERGGAPRDTEDRKGRDDQVLVVCLL
jgi:hypothetical protein